MSKRKLVTYVKYLKRQKLNDDDMQRVIVAIQKGEGGIMLAAKRYGV